MREAIIVGLGGFLGTVARYGCFLATSRLITSKLFIATLSVNLIGCLIIGILSGMAAKAHNQNILFWVTGFCGGYTTFSTFALDGLRLIREGLWGTFALYALVSMAGGLALCAVGFYFSDRL